MQAILGSVPGGASERNGLATMVRAEQLTSRWLDFGGRLMRGKIPARDRELVVLRTAYNCACAYEWVEHVAVGRTAGLTDEEIDAIATGSSRPWDLWGLTLLQAVDELHDNRCIADATWEKLAKNYDDSQLIELPMLVGHYEMVAMTFNTLGVQLD
jgi:4-carboxymuconolactone decarboxylase